jgi:hypothetical protein
MRLEVKCCSSPRGAKWAGFDQPPCYPQLEQVTDGQGAAQSSRERFRILGEIHFHFAAMYR